VKGIADTGFLVALVNSRDRYHEWALHVAEQASEPLLTCEPVVAEAAYHLQDVALVLEMVTEQFLSLSFNCNDHLAHLAALADLCLIRMSELYPHHRVITADEDFRVYRRNKREVIPLICPP